MKYFAGQLIYFTCACLVLIGCKTTSPIVKVDKNRKQIKVYSSNQKSSALSKAASHRSLDNAASVLEQKLKKSPRNVGVLLDLARVYLVKKNLDKAKQACQKALSYDLQSKRGAQLLAEIELANNNLRKAEIILYRIGGDTPKNADVYNLLGLIALKRGDNDNAYDLFKQGLKLDGNNAALRMNIGTLHMKYKQIAQATVQFERVLKTVPNHTDAMLHLGAARAHFGKTKNAEDLYKRVLKQDSENFIARYNLSLVQMRHGDLQDSLNNVGKVLTSSSLTSTQKKRALDHQAKLKAEIKQKQDESKVSQKSLAAKPLKKSPPKTEKKK